MSGSWSGHLVYWIGPVIGGILAALVYDNFLMEKRQGVCAGILLRTVNPAPRDSELPGG